MFRKYKITICLLILSVTVLSACKNKERSEVEEQHLSTEPVSVEKVEQLTAPSRVEVVGTIEAVERASIAARISGQIIELPVVLGSTIQKDDLLVKIGAGEISAKLLQAEAQLSQARRNLTRETKLQKQGASTEETVKTLQDSVRIAEAAFKEAKTMLGYTTISAPFSGTITKKIANVGDLASPGMVLVEMENGNALQVLAQVPESLVLKVTQGDKLSVSVPAASLTIEGIVAEVAPAANPLSRTAPVKINIPFYPNLRVGQFARVGLKGNKETTLSVPNDALLSKGQMDMVFVVGEHSQTATMRLVKKGAVYGDRVEILSGLEPSELVVVSNVAHLHDGQPLVVQ